VIHRPWYESVESGEPLPSATDAGGFSGTIDLQPFGERAVEIVSVNLIAVAMKRDMSHHEPVLAGGVDVIGLPLDVVKEKGGAPGL